MASDAEARQNLLANGHSGAPMSASKTAQAAVGHRQHTHRPLTPARLLRGITMLALLVVSAFIFLTGCIPAWAGLRTFNRSWGRRFASHLFGYWLAMWVLLFENVNGAKVVFSGEKVPEKERVLIMCNHLTEVDWMYLWCLAYRKKSVGSVKYALKATVRHAPIFGWAFHCLEFLLLERKWELDKDTIRTVMTSFRNRRDPLWEVVFPEGTDFRSDPCA
jgi:lysocardiolipin and lysophospholipid acyltransferase